MTPPSAFRLDTADGRPIHGVVHLPEAPWPRPAVVLCHGFKGFMEWGFFPPLAELLCERGFTVVRFNFSGGGMLPGDERVTDLDAFRRNTFSRERDEAVQVLDSLGDAVAPGGVDTQRVALFGHSRGGGAALLAAAGAPWRERLRALVTWSAVASFERWDEEVEAEWRRRGTVEVLNARTGQALELGVELLDDLRRHREALDLERAAAARVAPWLIVHGEEDETVPVGEAHTLQDLAAGEKELLVVPEASHTFGATHPFAGPTPQLTAAMNATQRWLRRHLGG